MARRHNKTAKTFQQRQAERRQREDQETTELVEEMASRYSCSVGIARDFAEQCTLRLDDVDFDLACNQLALDFWSSPPEPAQPVVDLLREIAAERQRHAQALTSIRERLQQLSDGPVTHHHLPLPLDHYERHIRDRLYPDPDPRPVQNHAALRDR
jgi:hypothetical protein